MDGVTQPIATSTHKIPTNHAESFHGHSHRNTSKGEEDCTKEKEPNVATIDIDTESAFFASAKNGKANATCDDNNQPYRNRCGHPTPPTSEINSSSTANVEGNVINRKWPAVGNDAGESLEGDDTQCGTSNGNSNSAPSAGNNLNTATKFGCNDGGTSHLGEDAAPFTTVDCGEIYLVKKAGSPSPSGRVFGINEVLRPNNFSFSSFKENGSCLRCTESKKHSHCDLCPSSLIFYYQSKAVQHIKQIHLHAKKTVAFREYKILPCKVFHVEKSFKRSDVYHFHCPLCNNVIQQRQYFMKHLEMHEEKRGSTVAGAGKNIQTKPYRLPSKSRENQDSHNDNNEKRRVVRENSDRVACAICGKKMHKKS
eukprot:Seg2285.2 transcript_id=Seg2285.2/GoldUCD/mRNA.D3Y31 product="hypothetical protein" protein_id=Seg2285.2/GoldUCD/D3Y31